MWILLAFWMVVRIIRLMPFKFQAGIWTLFCPLSHMLKNVIFGQLGLVMWSIYHSNSGLWISPFSDVFGFNSPDLNHLGNKTSRGQIPDRGSWPLSTYQTEDRIRRPSGPVRFWFRYMNVRYSDTYCTCLKTIIKEESYLQIRK